MEENIKKLLEISSNPGSNNKQVNLAINKDILKMLNQKNGFFAFKNALHVFSDEELNKINHLISKNNIYQNRCYYFAEDIFGNLFCEQDGKYYFLDLETGNYEFIGNSLDEWAKNILNDYNYFTGYPLADLWQSTHRPLNRNERLVPKKFFILGGEYHIDNLYEMDRIEAIKFREKLYKQIKDLPDGEEVILDII